MGRIFTAFLFIIIPFVKLFAAEDIAPCSNWNTNSSQCDSQPGCEWGGDNNSICKACDIDHFGEGCNSLCSEVAGVAFPFGHQHMGTCNGDSCAIRGARTKYECYKELDTADSGTPQGGHGYKCRNSADSDVDGCREYYRDDDTTDTATGLAYQGNANYHFVTCDASNVGLSDGSPSGYHMESNNQKCYSNTRNCDLFNSNNCSTTDSAVAQIVGTIKWEVYTHNNQQRLGWNPNTDSCNCTVKGNLTEKNCNGTKSNPSTGISYTGDSSTVSATITYSNPNSQSTWQTYSCTGCLAGYYAGGDNSSGFICEEATPGYYSTGCGTKWTADNPLYSNSNTISCWGYGNILKPCYAGMTSDSGATSVHDCRYTNQTQFCDAWGCTSYSNLVGSNGNNWWWYMRESTGSSGSVDSSNDEIPIDVTPFD